MRKTRLAFCGETEPMRLTGGRPIVRAESGRPGIQGGTRGGIVFAERLFVFASGLGDHRSGIFCERSYSAPFMACFISWGYRLTSCPTRA